MKTGSRQGIVSWGVLMRGQHGDLDEGRDESGAHDDAIWM